MRSSFLLTVSSFLSECSVGFILSDSFIKVINPELIIRVRGLVNEGSSGEVSKNLPEVLNESLPLVDSENLPGDANEIFSGDVNGNHTGADSDNLPEEFKNLKTVTLYEDLWHTKGDIVRNRLLAILGRGEAIFARKCAVIKLNRDVAAGFLDKNHLLGYSTCKYRYGLVYNREIVAVATFSASRPMKRGEVIVDSYEWVRYANLGSKRIVGGMGKIMNHFVKAERVQEIMSYADIDWGDGDVYRKLGFTLAGKTPPIEFYVNRDTFERISVKKLRNDLKYKSIPESDMVLIRNSGNLKFLRLFSLL